MKVLKISSMVIGLVLILAIAVSAQSSGGVPNSMRAFVNVFVAYMVAWAAVVAWIFVIARRLLKIEGDLQAEDN